VEHERPLRLALSAEGSGYLAAATANGVEVWRVTKLQAGHGAVNMWVEGPGGAGQLSGRASDGKIVVDAATGAVPSLAVPFTVVAEPSGREAMTGHQVALRNAIRDALAAGAIEPNADGPCDGDAWVAEAWCGRSLAVVCIDADTRGRLGIAVLGERRMWLYDMGVHRLEDEGEYQLEASPIGPGGRISLDLRVERRTLLVRDIRPRPEWAGDGVLTLTSDGHPYGCALERVRRALRRSR
jgi:hypothetical protein